jgi:hypothetical protein
VTQRTKRSKLAILYFTESNIEDMESDPEVETSMAIDYWFGKMYLKCTVAEEVLRVPTGRESLEAADVGQFLGSSSLQKSSMLTFPSVC